MNDKITEAGIMRQWMMNLGAVGSKKVEEYGDEGSREARISYIMAELANLPDEALEEIYKTVSFYSKVSPK